MMEAAETVEWMLASGEVDALMLEYNLIQRHRPRFNIRYRDDKSYPFLALTVGETWPRAQVMRGAKRKNVRYFGPYGHAWAIRDTLDALTRVFPVRTCTNSFFDSRARAGRPCLYYDIGRCSGPCVPSATGVTEESYRADVDALGDFLSGNTKPVIARLDREMREAAERQEYEQAAKLRDQLAAARRAMETQEMVLTQPEDLDVVGVAEDDLEAAFQVFFVRGGRVLGRARLGRGPGRGPRPRRSWWRRSSASSTWSGPRCRRGSWSRRCPADRDVLEAWLAARRGLQGVDRRAGARRQAQADGGREPERGRGVPPAQAAARVGLRGAVPRALRARRPARPAAGAAADRVLRHLEPGADRHGRLDGGVRGRSARSGATTGRFEIKGVPGQDDFASMEEMLRRRFARLIRERDEPVTSSRRRFAYPPSLVVVDGGKGQLGVCSKVLADLGLGHPAHRPGEAAGGGLLPGPARAAADPARRPRRCSSCSTSATRRTGSPSRITGRSGRSARCVSPLDEVPGVGPARKKALLKRFGSLARLRDATPDEIAATPGIGPELARAIHDRLHGGAAAERPGERLMPRAVRPVPDTDEVANLARRSR